MFVSFNSPLSLDSVFHRHLLSEICDHPVEYRSLLIVRFLFSPHSTFYRCWECLFSVPLPQCKIHKDRNCSVLYDISSAEISRNMEKLMNINFNMRHNVIIAMVQRSFLACVEVREQIGRVRCIWIVNKNKKEFSLG